MADTHHTLRALEQLSEHPEDVARLVFFTDIPPQKVLDAMVNKGRDLGLAFLGRGEAPIALGDVDDEELASVVALADEGIDCSDRGDRDGLAAAARTLSKRVGQEVTEQELRTLPGAMNTEPWARGLLLARNLLTRNSLAWSEARSVVARYFASIHALDDPSTIAFESLLDAVTPYPHIRIHHEMSEGSYEKLEETLHDVTRHVHPWGDAPPAPPPVTVEDAWIAARAWASARDSKEWGAAVSSKSALQQALDQVEVPELRELLSLHDANRRLRMVSLGLVSAQEPDLERTRPTPPVAELSTPERVKHSKFGVGEVVARVGQGENAVVEVRFADAVRKLQARFVSPLK